MYIGYTDEQEGLRQELRAYYDKLLTPEVVEALHQGFGTGPEMRRVVPIPAGPYHSILGCQ